MRRSSNSCSLEYGTPGDDALRGCVVHPWQAEQLCFGGVVQIERLLRAGAGEPIAYALGDSLGIFLDLRRGFGGLLPYLLWARGLAVVARIATG